MDEKDRLQERENNKEEHRHTADDERRRDGSKGGLDIDPDGAMRKQRRENESPAESQGTGIPGFGV